MNKTEKIKIYKMINGIPQYWTLITMSIPKNHMLKLANGDLIIDYETLHYDVNTLLEEYKELTEYSWTIDVIKKRVTIQKWGK